MLTNDWKTARCNGNGCVEVRADAGMVLVRDSKESAGPVLTFTGPEWAAFLDGARDGEFDL
jgi:hypothetical protein